MKPVSQNYQRAQATMETLLILPLVLGVIFLGLAFAVLWHAQALSAHLALEGSSREGAAPGSGVPFVQEQLGRLAGSFAIGPTTRHEAAGLEGENLVFSLSGEARLPWVPLGLNLATRIRAAVVAPVWEFIP